MFTQALSSNSSDFRRLQSPVFLYNGVYLYHLAKREHRILSTITLFPSAVVFLSFETRPENSAPWGMISRLKVSFPAQVSVM